MRTRGGEALGRHASEFPCPTCPFREGSFCGAVIERRLDELPSDGQAPWKSHEGSPAGRVLYRKGFETKEISVLCHGWAMRLVPLADGRRQILSIILPGELFSVAQVFSDTLHFTVMSLTDVRFTRFQRPEIRQMIASDSTLMDNLGRNGIKELQDKDKLTIDLANRRAEERIAHLFLRLFDRLSEVGAYHRDSFPVPLRQQHLAEMTGLTAVHVSRVVTDLRKKGIADLSGGRLTVLDRDRLEALGYQS